MKERYINKRLRILFHSLGLSCLGGSIFLQILVFMDIIQHGYFIAVENNPVVLFFETTLTLFAFVYFIYIYQRDIISLSQSSPQSLRE